ncbi:MAG: helix-hairpin-helix domain-containing protein [Gemmatimonadales bacterium]
MSRASPKAAVRRARDPLQVIPGIGPSLARDLRRLGYHTPAELRDADPEEMYQRLGRLTRTRQDPCVLYTFRCAVYYASRSRHRPELLLWWNWKDRPYQRN